MARTIGHLLRRMEGKYDMSDRASDSAKAAGTNVLYQRIGEFVVGFQWLEHRFREIGWLILDPNRTAWPPTSLRTERNEQLIERVRDLLLAMLETLDIDDREERKLDFASIAERCHELRRKRNVLLHSAFTELKAGGEVLAIMRSNPRLKIDASTGEPLFDHEVLTEPGLTKLLRELADAELSVNAHYMQLIHWAPFDHLQRASPSAGG